MAWLAPPEPRTRHFLAPSASGAEPPRWRSQKRSSIQAKPKTSELSA